MKILIVILVIVGIIAAGLFWWISKQGAFKSEVEPATETETEPTEVEEREMEELLYKGFMDLGEGMWVEYGMDGSKMKTAYIGDDTISGKNCWGYENSMSTEEGETVTQMWMDKSDKKMVKYVQKIGGQVICMDISDISETDVPESETPSEFDPADKTYFLSSGTYTTPTGKTVNVAKYKIGETETWISSEVPLGTVKVITGGKTTMELYDFGLSGAKRSISKDEMENCISLPTSIPSMP